MLLIPKYIYIYIYQPLRKNRMQPKVNFKRSLIGLNYEFSFSLTCGHRKVKDPSLPYYLPITEVGMIGFIPFPSVSTFCEM